MAWSSWIVLFQSTSGMAGRQSMEGGMPLLYVILPLKGRFPVGVGFRWVQNGARASRPLRCFCCGRDARAPMFFHVKSGGGLSFQTKRGACFPRLGGKGAPAGVGEGVVLYGKAANQSIRRFAPLRRDRHPPPKEARGKTGPPAKRGSSLEARPYREIRHSDCIRFR
jgi:hypothetical protein